MTACISDRRAILGQVNDGRVQLSREGVIVEEHIRALPQHYGNCRIDALVVMPNHIHVNIQILDKYFLPKHDAEIEARLHGLSEMVRSFKSFSSRAINALLGTPGMVRWQRGFYDHIIRDVHSLHRIREYMQNNPMQWLLDRENPAASGKDPLFQFVEEQDLRPLPRPR